MKRLAIIGGGWVGCHLALTLGKEAEVTVYEKSDKLLAGTSLVNQNRLHYGYHYARNASTRRLCADTFHRFLKDYGSVVHDVRDNLYAVSEDESLLDAATVSLIFDKWPLDLRDATLLDHTSMLFGTMEKRISPIEASVFFEQHLRASVKQEEVQPRHLTALRQDYDFVLDCTNNALLPPLPCHFFETVVMFLCRPTRPLPFGALTYIDGELFSLYPYDSECFSLSHVRYGILNDGSSGEVGHAKENMVNHVMRYWPDFQDSFEFLHPVFSIKAKIKSGSANRAPVIRQEDNLLSFFTGKIQGIYAIEQMAKTIIR